MTTMSAITAILAPCATALILFTSTGCKSGPGAAAPDEEPRAKSATATLDARSGSTMTGTATFTTEGDEVELRIDVSGLPAGKHGVHIHEKGDCSTPDAMSAGEHWNPTNEAHGKFGEHPFHRGDIGNIDVGDDGRGSLSMSTDLWTLGTGGPSDVVGRSIVVHADPDDFKTQPAGAAGTRVGCGVIRQQ